LTQEEIDSTYNSEIKTENIGPLFHVLAMLLKTISGIERITVPGEFRSAKNPQAEAIQTQHKVSDGWLYPMKSSLLFIQKPIVYIKHKEIKYVEFVRISSSANMGSGKSFDINIVKHDGETKGFKNLDKSELKVLMLYFKKANIKMRQIDPDSNRGVDLDDMNEQDVDEEIRQS